MSVLHGNGSSRHKGDVTFGTRDYKPFDDSVKTRQMTQEEIDRYFGKPKKQGKKPIGLKHSGR